MPMGTLTLESPAFAHNGRIPPKYTCDGDNVSPPLRISGVPKGTQGLVLIVDDPDAPRGDWVHWTVWNIPPGTMEIPEGRAPSGAIEGMTDFEKPGYGGPCPPSGTHRYHFKLSAVDTAFDFETRPTKGDLEQAIKGHVLDSAVLIGLYSR